MIRNFNHEWLKEMSLVQVHLGHLFFQVFISQIFSSGNQIIEAHTALHGDPYLFYLSFKLSIK